MPAQALRSSESIDDVSVAFFCDEHYMNQVIRDPEVYFWGTEDGAQDRAVITMRRWLDDEANRFMKVWVGGTPTGFFCGNHLFDGVYQVHACLLRPCRGVRAIQAARQSIAKIFRCGAQALVARISTHERHAYVFAKWVGFRQCAKIKPGIGKMVNGKQYVFRDMILTRKEWEAI